MQREHYITKILYATPVNKKTAIVVSQSGCVKSDEPLTKSELVYLVDRLKRKHRLLKVVLGIKTKAQHTNLMYKFNKKLPQFRYRDEPRAFIEYVRVGQDIKRLVGELHELKTIRRFVAQCYPNKSWSQA